MENKTHNELEPQKYIGESTIMYFDGSEETFQYLTEEELLADIHNHNEFLGADRWEAKIYEDNPQLRYKIYCVAMEDTENVPVTYDEFIELERQKIDPRKNIGKTTIINFDGREETKIKEKHDISKSSMSDRVTGEQEKQGQIKAERLKASIAHWYDKAKEDYNIDGKVEDVLYEKDTDSIVVQFSENKTPLQCRVLYSSDYTAEQVYNIWMDGDAWETRNQPDSKINVSKPSMTDRLADAQEKANKENESKNTIEKDKPNREER